MTENYKIKPIEIDRFDDYYYMRKLSQLNQRLGFCSTLADYSYASKDGLRSKTDLNQTVGQGKKLADCSERKLVMAAFNTKDQTVGMAGLSYQARTRAGESRSKSTQGSQQGSIMVYLWGVYVEKPHRKSGVARKLIAAALERIKDELSCKDEDIVLTVMDSQFDLSTINSPAQTTNQPPLATAEQTEARTYQWNSQSQALVVNLQGMTKGENRIDQALGFDSDPATISSKIPKAS